MTDFTILAKFRNKEQVEELVIKIKQKGYSCYNFCDTPANPKCPENNGELQMEEFEKTKDFFKDKYFEYIFKKDLTGLKNANKVIVLMPAGKSVHIETGIAYGLGKDLILIGEPEKPESLYLIFKERYKTTNDFLKTI